MSADALYALELRLAAGLAEDARAAGVPEAVARVLMAAEEERGVSMREVARRVDRDPTTVTRFVDRASSDGWVERRPGTADRRQRMVVLTDAGRELRDALLATRQQRATRWLEDVQDATGLGEGQVSWFLDALIRAADASTEEVV